MQSTERWRAMIEAEHAQSEGMRGTSPPDDHWEPHAQQFKADPLRSDDPLVDRILQWVASEHTVIDVGAGAGRLALPLALRCRHVTAVEPSPSMAAVLLQQAADYRIRNVSVVQSQWQEAEVEPADVVICAHVLYTIPDVELFVRKLEAHGRERVLIVLFKTPPQSQIYPLWKKVHGMNRLPLPSLPEFEEVLQELGIDAQLDQLPPQGARGFDSPAQALEQLGRRLYLSPGSHKRELLEGVLPDLLEEADGAFRIWNARPMEPSLVSWRPGTTVAQLF